MLFYKVGRRCSRVDVLIMHLVIIRVTVDIFCDCGAALRLLFDLPSWQRLDICPVCWPQVVLLVVRILLDGNLQGFPVTATQRDAREAVV